MINYSEIQKRINYGLITSRKHPTLSLEILNYTQKVQFDKLWDDYTKICRGLILDENHNIVARPFPKFFNLNETPETLIQNLPNEVPEITEKVDGSLGILYFDDIKHCIATRGSFDSEQAIWATEWLKSKDYTRYDFLPDYTYLFEIIYPGSKNVVDYKGKDGLVLLAIISNKDGSELDIKKESDIIEIPCVKSYDFEDISHIEDYLKTIPGTELEGFVCKYSSGLRVKIKSEDYRRLHKILTGFTEKDVLEALSQGKSLDSFISLVPDEFYQWIKDTEAKLTDSKDQLMNKATKIALEASKIESRKDQAIYIIKQTKTEPKGFSGLVFNILDGRTELVEKSAWNVIKS